MGSEYELKFRADTDSQKSVYTTFPARWETIHMETTYYDTPNGSLSTKRYMFRRRMENNRGVFTLKTPGDGKRRGEWEVKSDSIAYSVYRMLRDGCPEVLADLYEEGLQPICGAKFTRKAGTFKLRECVLEIALDEGILFGGGREIPLCEIEVEHKEGSIQATEDFARQLADIYGLQAESKSKFARALALTKED